MSHNKFINGINSLHFKLINQSKYFYVWKIIKVFTGWLILNWIYESLNKKSLYKGFGLTH